MVGNGHELPVGTQIGDFRVAGTLGAGGFGITYLADDLRLGRKVALKEFFPEQFAQRLANGGVKPKSGGNVQKTFE